MKFLYKIAAYAIAKEHQRRALNKLKNTDTLLLYHGTGSGKTLTSLLAAKQEGLDATVIGPASLRHNYPKEQKKHGLNSVKTEYHSYNKPPEDEASTKSKLLIFDEAHNMGRVESQRSHYPDKYQGKKEIYMTATPIRNTPDELIPILRGMGVKTPRDRKTFNKTYIEEEKVSPNIFARVLRGVKPGVKLHPKNLKRLSKALHGKVDYYKPDTSDFPETSTKTISTEMSKNQYRAYKEMLKGNPSLSYKIRRGLPPDKSEARRLNSFLSASRQISNTSRAYDKKFDATKDEPKITRMANEIQKRIDADANYRGVSYSSYLRSGVNPLSERLTKMNIPHATFTGKLSPKQKKDIITQYNTGKIKHLLVSGAGAEGLDLKGTKLLQIMEPHWNSPRIEQVKGRAVRIGSHAHLPKKERKVEIQRYIAKPREEGIFFKSRPKGADEYLTMMSKSKKDLNDKFLKVLQNA